MRHIEKQSIARVSSYDRTNGFVVSAIMIVGFLVGVLFIIWWTQEFRLTFTQSEPMKPGKFVNVSLDEVALDLSEFPPAAAPQFKTDIALVQNAVSTIKASELVKSDFKSDFDSEGTRRVGPIGIGGGPRGDDPEPTLPEHRRWRVMYKQVDYETYLRTLDYFQIEIGIVHLNKNRIVRVGQVNSDVVVCESDRAAESESVYFQNEKSIARRWDRKIARDQGVDLSNTATVHFYSDAALDAMRSAEAQRIQLDGKKIGDVKAVEFVIESEGAEFVFQVATIEYH